MKFINNYLQNIENIDKLQSGVFVFFFVLFIAVVAWVMIGDKKMYQDNGKLPLDDDNQ